MANFDDEDVETPPSAKEPADMESSDLGQLPGQSDDDSGQEYDASEEIGQEAAGVPADDSDGLDDEPSPFQLPPTPSKSHPDMDRYQQFMNQYKALQDQRQKGLLTAGLLQAGGQIGQAIAGKHSGNFKADDSGIKTLEALANQPVKDFEDAQKVNKNGIALQDEKDARDPSSKMSKAYRDYAKNRLKIDLDDDVSAFDVQNLLKAAGKPASATSRTLLLTNSQTGKKVQGIYNPATQTMTDLAGNPLGPEYVAGFKDMSFVDPKSGERHDFNTSIGRDMGAVTGPGVTAPITPNQPGDLESEKPIQINRSFLNAQQAKQVDQARATFEKEIKDDRNNLNATQRTKAILAEGGKIGDLPSEIQDQMSRAFGQKGHITDAQMGRAMGRSDALSKAKAAYGLFVNGKIDDENRRFLMDVMDVIGKQNANFIDNKAQVYSSNLMNDLKSAPNMQKYKLDPNSAKSLLGVDAASFGMNQKASAPEGKVRVKNLKTGQEGYIPKEKLDAAIKSQNYQEVK